MTLPDRTLSSAAGCSIADSPVEGEQPPLLSTKDASAADASSKAASEQTPLLPKDASDAAPGDAAEDSPISAALIGATLALVYIVISSAMIAYVKFLMHEDRFPFAVCLTTLHMFNAFGLASVLRRFSPGLFPSAPAVFAGLGEQPGGGKGVSPTAVAQALAPFAPIACFGGLGIVFANRAYLYADVSFLQMVKESHVIIVYVLMVFFGLDALLLRHVVVLGFVGVSAAVAVGGASATSFATAGLLLQLFAGFAASMQMVLTNRLMSQSKGPRVDPLTMVLCTSPVMLCALVPATYLFWDPRIPERLRVWWPYLLGNALLAFALQVITAITIKRISATGYALASVLKDLSIVLVGSSLIGEHLTYVQVAGFIGSVMGISTYSAMKMFPARFGH